MAVFLAIVDLMKGIAWPLAIVAATWLFRSEIRGLVPRIEELGPGGVKLRRPEAAATEQKKIESGPSQASGDIQLQDIPGLGRTEAIAELEKLLHSALEAQTETAEARVNRLIRLLAEARLTAEFERIYRVIYGSQIAGLNALNSEGRVLLEDARRRFEPVALAHPDLYKDGGFDRWLGFLLHTGLVTRRDEAVELTPLGRDFLVFLTQRGYREDRPF